MEEANSEEEYRGSISEEECNQLEATSSAAKRRRRGIQENMTPPQLEHRHRAQSIIQSKALDELEVEVFETGLYENVDFHRGSRISVLLAEIAYSALWWSVVHSLSAVMWFYPLCAMEISGFEVVCTFYLSPVLTLIGPIRRAVSTPLGLMGLRLLTLVGVASFQAPSTLSRLLVLAVGNFFAMLTLSATWWGMSKLDRHRYVYTHFLGYLLLLAVRVWGTSFNPIFMGFTSNNLATAAGAILAIYLYFNNWRTPIVEEKGPKKPSGRQGNKKSSFPGLVATGVAFGALFFLSHFLFGEASVISRWAVVPYPEVGPSPYPWGLVTILALSIGVVVFGHQFVLLGSLGWLAVGLTSAMGLYFLNSFNAYFAGVMLAVYIASSWAYLAKRLVRFPAGKVLPLAMLTYVVLILTSVWVVAYNFVPGGTLTRERTDVLLAITVLLIGLGARSSQQPEISKGKGKEIRGKRKKYSRKQKVIKVFGRAIRRLSTISEGEEPEDKSSDVWGSVHEKRIREVYLAEEKEYQKFHDKVIWVAFGILLLAALGFAYRYQPPVTMPVKEHPKVFSGGIWAFHFGYDNEGWPSMERAAQLINDTGVDVIGLLETDASRPYIGSHDIASWLSERLRMHVDFGPPTKDHTWGALILSKYPIVSSEHFLLPSPEGELAPAVLASINVSGHIVDFFCVHFGNDVDILDRKLQAERSAEILSNISNPVVVLSYITNPPGSRDYLRLIEHGGVKDIDPNDKKRWCEYLFYRGVIRLGYARISHGRLSDTEIQVGKFRVPDYPGEPDNPAVTQKPSEVPEWTHFPAMFGSLYHGHYRDESRHHFHMATPKYFRQH